MSEKPRVENVLQSMIDGTEYTEPAQSRLESLLLELKEVIEESGGTSSIISVSPTLTLTVEGWSNNQQTVAYEHNTDRRNVIDVMPTDIQEWANAGVYGISETSSGITFVCNVVPSKALTFKVTSMVIHNEDNIQSET